MIIISVRIGDFKMGILIDIVILITISYVGFKCYFMGFTRSIWGWTAIVISIFVASRTWFYLAEPLGNLIKDEQFLKFISILIVAFAVAIVVHYFFKNLSVIVQKGVISWIDGALGIIFGIVVSILGIGIILILLEVYAGNSVHKFIVQSKFALLIIKFTRYVIGVSKVAIDKSQSTPI